MRARHAEFVTSAAGARDFPPPELPEVAFAGRSNVGKSSLINALTGFGHLARTSRTPGRTRLINWFRITPPEGEPIAFVDLPGYGYAKVSHAMRDSWRPLVESYLGDRECLRLVLVLVDIRRGAEQEERDLLEWIADKEIPARLVITKSDKLPKSKRKPAAVALRRELSLTRDPILFSAPERLGADSLWRAIAAHCQPL